MWKWGSEQASEAAEGAPSGRVGVGRVGADGAHGIQRRAHRRSVGVNGCPNAVGEDQQIRHGKGARNRSLAHSQGEVSGAQTEELTCELGEYHERKGREEQSSLVRVGVDVPDAREDECQECSAKAERCGVDCGARRIEVVTCSVGYPRTKRRPSLVPIVRKPKRAPEADVLTRQPPARSRRPGTRNPGPVA